MSNSKNKFVIFYPHIIEYGGVERVIISLGIEIRRRGLQLILLCYYDNIDMSKYAGFPIETRFLKDSWNPFVKSYRLRQWVKKNISMISGSLFVFGGKAGYYAGLAFLNNYVLHYTDPPSLLTSPDKDKKRPLSFFNNLRSQVSDSIIALGVKRAHLCITMTQQNAVELQSIYHRSFLVVYQGGVPAMSKATNFNKCGNDKLVLFSICRLANSKNLDWIISSFLDLQGNVGIKKLYASIEVIIAGKGPDKERLENLVIAYGLEKDILFPGFLDKYQLEETYEKADVFLVPGVQGYGLPILEALYRGVPVVMNIESRISEILTDNSWVAISTDDVDNFSKCLIQHIETIRKEPPSLSFIENLPTEEKWASEIGHICKWW